jgi:hypothetical protein
MKGIVFKAIYETMINFKRKNKCVFIYTVHEEVVPITATSPTGKLNPAGLSLKGTVQRDESGRYASISSFS